MTRRNIRFSSVGRLAARAMALATVGGLLAGCTIYASGTDDWDSNHHSGSARDEYRAPVRSVVPVSLIGREVRVHLREPDDPVEGTIRDMGEWVRLERNGSTMFIPRDHIRYVEAIAPPTTQP